MEAGGIREHLAFGWGRLASLILVVAAGLAVLWYYLLAALNGLPGAPAPQASQVTQTLTTFTIQAAFAVPISVLVCVVGAALTLASQPKASERTAAQVAHIGRLRRLLWATGWVTAIGLFLSVVGLPFVATDLYAGQSVAISTAIPYDGVVLSVVMLEVAMVALLLQELIWNEPRWREEAGR